MFLKSNGFSGKNKGSNKQNMVIHIILLISQFIIALKWLIIKYSKHYWYLKTNSLNYICFAKHELPGGPETALTKCTFSKKILFSLQRNTQFDRQHLAKFECTQIWPNLRFVWVFGKMCMSLFHPLLEQAFQRRDSFFLEATVSIDIQEKIFAF